jgi:hypothetical protein
MRAGRNWKEFYALLDRALQIAGALGGFGHLRRCRVSARFNTWRPVSDSSRVAWELGDRIRICAPSEITQRNLVGFNGSVSIFDRKWGHL